MPNGGSSNCRSCWYNCNNVIFGFAANYPGPMDNAYCIIRQCPISNPLWTYCNSYNSDTEQPKGPIYSASFSSDGKRLPWYYCCKPKIFDESSSCHICNREITRAISVQVDDNTHLQFCCENHYMRWWHVANPHISLPWKYKFDAPDKKSSTENPNRFSHQDYIFSFLHREGYLHSVDDDGIITFEQDGTKFKISLSLDDEQLFQLSTTGFRAWENEAFLQQLAKQAAVATLAESDGAIIYLDSKEKKVIASIKGYYHSVDAFIQVISRLQDSLVKTVNDFCAEMRRLADIIVNSSAPELISNTPIQSQPVEDVILGGVVGDIIGSAHEGYPLKETSFPLFGANTCFTDDTVLTIAVAKAILTGEEYEKVIARFARKYPKAGYGARFFEWALSSDPQPYNSWGNGSAMRVSPVGLAFNSVKEVLVEAEKTAMPTHNHPEGIKGAQAIALAVFMARKGSGKDKIKKEIASRFDYDLDRTLANIRPDYYFEISCQRSVPESIIAFLESDSVEGAIRNAVSLGGDADTMACMAGAIAHAFYGTIPADIARKAAAKLPDEFIAIQNEFAQKFMR